MAGYEAAEAGFAAGARYATHLFNAMPALHHREPGLAAAALADPRVVVGLIADGLHVHPALVDLVWRLLGPERLNLVTDAMAAMGMSPGQYLLGDYRVTVDETSARLPDGTLAGCVLSLDAILRVISRLYRRVACRHSGHRNHYAGPPAGHRRPAGPAPPRRGGRCGVDDARR